MTRFFIGTLIVVFLILAWIAAVEVTGNLSQQVQNIVDVLP